MTSEELLSVLSALGHVQRLRVITELSGGRTYVSELARRLGLSRPLLHMHLKQLEGAGIVAGRMELSAEGKALKYFELAPFEVRLNVAAVLAAAREDDDAARVGDAADPYGEGPHVPSDTEEPDAAKPDAAKPDAAKPDAAKPNNAKGTRT